MPHSFKTAVLVAGSWGTALASVLAEKHEVMLWTRNQQQADEINREHTNSRFLPNVQLSQRIKATTNIKEALEGIVAVVLVCPSSAMRELCQKISPYITDNMLLVHATKGFESQSLKRMSEVIGDELPQYNKERIVVLSGPSHAEEVIQQCPTTVVVASAQIEAAEEAQKLFMSRTFRVYTNPDLIGVELGGALKNIIAIGGGLSDGLGFGDNAKAALLTRGLAEIKRLGTIMGARPSTFAGLSGIGDLIVTCTSQHSRNWRAGYMLAQNKSMELVLKDMGMVVEGVKTTESAFALSRQHNIEMPIAEQLYLVLFKNKKPRDAVEALMNRDRAQELEEFLI